MLINLNIRDRVDHGCSSLSKGDSIGINLFRKANIPFRAIDFTLQPPLPEEGPRTGFEIHFDNFRYEDIYEEGLVDRIKAAHEALEAYYAEQDGK